MKLCLLGHDYKYAVEQVFLIFFPDEKPQYAEEKPQEGDYALVTLKESGDIYSAETEISLGGEITVEKSDELDLKGCDRLALRRELQKILKLSFYGAAVRATGKKAPWGAITNIRPVKIAARFIEDGVSNAEAERILREDYFVSAEKASLALETAKVSVSVKNSLSEREISLYLGIPFCPTRCSYCSFVSNSVEKSMALIEPYLQALFHEIEAAARLARETGLRIISVYIGGGTPTTLSALQLERLLSKINSEFDLSAIREFTVEAGRADTVDDGKLRAIKAGGADRISINPQTMNDEVLKAIGRRHTAEDVKRAFEAARRVGFKVINSDLIAGLPTDTPEGFRNSLNEVLSLAPENVTVHTLAVKRGSKLNEGGFLPSEPSVREMLENGEAMLRRAGYGPYYLYRQKFTAGNFENLGWCKEGLLSLYNICIMDELQTILSLGAGGVTKLVDQKSGRIERIFNAKYPYEYISGIEKEISSKEYLKEFLNKYTR